MQSCLFTALVNGYTCVLQTHVRKVQIFKNEHISVMKWKYVGSCPQHESRTKESADSYFDAKETSQLLSKISGLSRPNPKYNHIAQIKDQIM